MPDSFEGMEATLASPSENFVSHKPAGAGSVKFVRLKF
jgi:hypothetical protein